LEVPAGGFSTDVGDGVARVVALPGTAPLENSLRLAEPGVGELNLSAADMPGGD